MKDETSFRARTRAHSLLLRAQGTTIKDIAKTYQVHRHRVGLDHELGTPWCPEFA